MGWCVIRFKVVSVSHLWAGMARVSVVASSKCARLNKMDAESKGESIDD